MSSKSGIKESPSGDRHIPSSKRADGSLRKEIRVRPGYKPPEDVEVYKNRTASTWKTSGKGGVPGAEFVETPKLKKPAKSRASKADISASEDAAKATKPVSEPSMKGNAALEEPLGLEAEKQKEAKKLSKKLRQAGELQQKKEKGDALLPEQFAKVIKMNELIRQLDKLGFDAEGHEKP